MCCVDSSWDAEHIPPQRVSSPVLASEGSFHYHETLDFYAGQKKEETFVKKRLLYLVGAAVVAMQIPVPGAFA